MVCVEQDDSGQLLTQARLNPEAGLGPLLEKHRSYLGLLARVQIGRRLQGRQVEEGCRDNVGLRLRHACDASEETKAFAARGILL